MRGRFTALAAVALVGCANAPIDRTGENEYAIGQSKRDSIHSDAKVQSQHYQRSNAWCQGQGGWAEAFEPPPPPDGRYHFRCVMPPPPPAPATPQQLEAAGAAWRECQVSAEAPIDDMLSDANTVAAVLATRCENEFYALLVLVHLGQAGPLAPFSSFNRVRHSFALDIVLRERAKRRSPKTPPPPVAIPKLTPESL